MAKKFKILILISLALVYPFLLHSHKNYWNVTLQFSSFSSYEIDNTESLSESQSIASHKDSVKNNQSLGNYII